MSRCLVVDDDPSQKTLMIRQIALAEPGIQIDSASNYEEGIKSLKKQHYDFVLCDVILPDSKSGVDLWRMISASGDSTPFVMTSGLKEDQFFAKFSPFEHAPQFLPKPFRLHDLRSRINSILPRIPGGMTIPLDLNQDPDLNLKSLRNMVLFLGAGVSLISTLQLIRTVRESTDQPEFIEQSNSTEISAKVANTPLMRVLLSREVKLTLASLLQDDIMPAVRSLKR